tara:strand:+ start:869 stop:1519 length:651 start_codon:yes stop_codon:yes gene_type:complete
MNLTEVIKKVIKEGVDNLSNVTMPTYLRRRVKVNDISTSINRNKIRSFRIDNVKGSIKNTIQKSINDIIPFDMDEIDNEDFNKDYDFFVKELKKYLIEIYTKELTLYFEKRQMDSDAESNQTDVKYIFSKHSGPYGGEGFSKIFNSFNEMINSYGDWVDVDWDDIKSKLNNIVDYPEPTFTGKYNSRPLRISNAGDEGNDWGYNFSVIKQIPTELS